MRVRVYIAGPMTGYKNFNREAFHKAEGDGLPEAKRTDKRGGYFTMTWPEAFTTVGIAMAVALIVYSICRWG